MNYFRFIIRDVNSSKRIAIFLLIVALALALGSCRNSEPAKIGTTAPDFTVNDGQKTRATEPAPRQARAAELLGHLVPALRAGGA